MYCFIRYLIINNNRESVGRDKEVGIHARSRVGVADIAVSDSRQSRVHGNK